MLELTYEETARWHDDEIKGYKPGVRCLLNGEFHYWIESELHLVDEQECLQLARWLVGEHKRKDLLMMEKNV